MVKLDPKITVAIEKLEEALGVFGKQTGSQFTVLIVPHSHEQPVYASEQGKKVEGYTLESLLNVALHMREINRVQERNSDIAKKIITSDK
jgi:hypothetical protein